MYSQYVTLPDTAFEKALIGLEHDDVLDGKILRSTCEGIDTLVIDDLNIKVLTGIEAFVNLTALNCNDNKIVNLDLSNNDSLLYLICARNSISTLIMANGKRLVYLDCRNNELEELDLSCSDSLLMVYCQDNNLFKLNLSFSKSLFWLECNDNYINSLNIEGCTSLGLLDCRNTSLTTIDISTNLELVEFFYTMDSLRKVYISKLSAHDIYSDPSNFGRGQLALFIRVIRK